METTEAEAMKDVMNLLETEPSSENRSSRTARNISSEWKLQRVHWSSTYPRTNQEANKKKC